MVVQASTPLSSAGRTVGIIHSKFSFDGFRQLNTAAALATQAFTSEDKEVSDGSIVPRYVKEELFQGLCLGL